jgi:hypothetical protein
MAKTACRQKQLTELPPNHNTSKKMKKVLIMLPCLARPHAAAACIAATARSTPTKLVGNLTHIPIDIPIEAICEIFNIFQEIGAFLHNSEYIDDESSSPTGASHALEASMAMALVWECGMACQIFKLFLGWEKQIQKLPYLNRRNRTMTMKLQQSAMFAQS